jgi:flavodoxin
MKALIIYVSIHHRNTKKNAQEMAETLYAEFLQPRDVDVTKLVEMT